MLVFVYGSLKRRYGNHGVMKRAGGNFVGVATLSGHRMFSLGGFPGILPSDDLSHVVTGELYEVDPDRIGTLDALEGYSLHHEPNSMYLRRVRTVATPDGDEVSASVYIWNGSRGDRPWVSDGVW
jgi:gamma-glutamylcyclotransferase (GGCT)/AIG2-like uncharacterized protein YtfP